MSDVKGFDIKIGLDTSEVSQKLKGFQSQLKSTQNELKNISSNLKLNPKSITDLTQKSRLLKDAIKNVAAQLSLQEKELQKAKKLLDSGMLEGGQAAFDALQNRVNKTKESLGYFNSELERTQQRLEYVKKEKWQAVGDLGTSLSSLTKVIAGLAAAFVGFVSASVHSLSALSDSAAQAGMTAEEYQRLGVAANTLGVKTEDAAKGVTKVNSVMASLLTGTGANYEKLLNRIGLSYRDLEKLSPEDAFKAISDALKNCEDSTTALYVAQQIFGAELATKIMPLIMAGSEAIDELEGSATVASNESVDSAKKISGAINRVKTAFIALAGNIASYVEPIVEKATSWIQTNVLPTLQRVVDAFFSMDEGTQKMIVTVVGIIAALGPLLIMIGKIGTGTSSIFKIFKSGKVGLIVAAVVALAAALIKLYRENEDFRQSVQKLFGVLKGFLSNIMPKIKETFDRLMPVLNQLFTILGELITDILDALTPIVQELLEIIADKILPVILELVEDLLPIIAPILKLVAEVIKIIAGVLQVIWKILEPIVQLLGFLFQKLGEWLEESGFGEWLQSICDGLSTFCGWIGQGIDAVKKWFGMLDDGSEKSGFQSWIEGISNWFVELVANILKAIDTIKAFFAAMGEATSQGFENFGNGWNDFWSNFGNGWNNFWGNVGNGIANGWDAFTDWLSSWTGGWKKGATGGVVKGATPMIVGEAGAEAIMPLERNTGWLSKMAAMIAQAMPAYIAQTPAIASGGSTSNTYNVTINTTASSMSIREIDEALGGVIK